MADPIQPAGAPEAPPPPLEPVPDTLAAALKLAEELDPAVPETEQQPPEAELTEETAAPETQPPAVPPQSEEEVRIGERLADLSRADRTIREERARLRDERAQFSAEIEKAKQFDARELQIQTALKEDPIGTLQKFGVDILDVLQHAGGDEAPQRPDPKLSRLEQRLAQLEEERAAERREAEEHAKKRSEQGARQQIAADIRAALDPDKHELILESGDQGIHGVYLALNAMFQETGRPPGPEEYRQACAITEEAFRQHELQELERKAKAKRLAGRLTLGSQATTISPATALPNSPRQPATLTNDLTRTPPTRRQPETEEERLAAAFAIPIPVGQK